MNHQTKRGPKTKQLPVQARRYLGKKSDPWIAERFGVSVHVVKRTRKSLGIEPVSPSTCTVPDVILGILGVLPDPTLVKLCDGMGVPISKQRLFQLRQAKHIPAATKTQGLSV